MRRLAPLVAVTAALVAAAPASACTTPKERYTAAAEFQNATYLFTGQTGDALSRALSALGSGTGAQPALTDLISTASGGSAAYASAAAHYLAVISQPDCGRATSRPARRAPRPQTASAGRRT